MNLKKISLIGEGTYGNVYSGLINQTKVAIKETKNLDEDEGIPFTILREIGALKNLKHPNIVELLAIYYPNIETFNLIFPYYEKSVYDLQEYYKDLNIKVPYQYIKQIIYQMLRALSYMHKHHYIHRDIKPQNIMMNKDKDKLYIKLIDFGLVTNISIPGRKLEREVVTLPYRPPELLKENKNDSYSYSIDIWSLGCVFGELIKGDFMFNPGGWCEFDMLMKIKKYRKKNQIYSTKISKKFKSILDEIGIHLLKKMLAYRQEYRIKAKDGIKHPWFYL